VVASLTCPACCCCCRLSRSPVAAAVAADVAADISAVPPFSPSLLQDLPLPSPQFDTPAAPERVPESLLSFAEESLKSMGLEDDDDGMDEQVSSSNALARSSNALARSSNALARASNARARA